MLVKTNPGEICPREENPRSCITDDPKGTEVADSAYYRRLIDDGSLVLVTPPAPAQKNKGGDV